jgi:hypothetical protein
VPGKHAFREHFVARRVVYHGACARASWVALAAAVKEHTVHVHVLRFTVIWGVHAANSTNSIFTIISMDSNLNNKM